MNLTNAEKAKIFRAEAAHQCDIAAAFYADRSLICGDRAMDNAAALMRIAADCEEREKHQAENDKIVSDLVKWSNGGAK